MAMLEGLEISIIKKSDLERTNRVDSEFYSKANLAAIDTIKKLNPKSLTDCFNVSDGNHMSISENFSEEGVPYYRGGDIYNFFIEHTQQPLRIPKEIFDMPTMKRSHLQKGDLLVSIVGAIIGNLSLVKTKQLATCSCKLAILRPKTIQPEFAAIFFKSKYGQTQLQKFRRGTGQTGLILEDFDQFLLPIFSVEFRKQIVDFVNNSFDAIDSSKKMLNKAKDNLLTILDLDNWHPIEETTTVKSFSNSFAISGRLDAEYYQPKYDELEKLIEDYGFMLLKDISQDITTGFPYDSSNYSESEGVDLIRINNLSIQGLDLTKAAKIPVSDTLLSPRDKVKKGDILISMSGTVGLTSHVQEEVEAYVNQRIMKFTPKSYDAEVLALVINSIIGKMQLDRIGTGGVQTNLSNSDILNIKIPLLPIETQKELALQIKQSFKLRQQSDKLIDIAKQAVEMAIEQNEEAALKFIKANTA